MIQICDLIANKPLKQKFKQLYVAWKIRSDPGPGGKYKVDRKNVISWLEVATEEVNDIFQRNSAIQKAFLTYGQDHRSEDQSELESYLASHEGDGVYKSLLANQQSLELN